jgi:hypothetical protein
MLQEDPRALQAMDGYGWESLVGVKASIERRRTNATLLSSGSPNQDGEMIFHEKHEKF